MAKTQAICDCIITEFTAAPIYLEVNKKGGHEWLIEFEKAPKERHGLVRRGGPSGPPDGVGVAPPTG
jgi:hypothetical protein